VLGLVRLASAVEVALAARLQQAHGICATDLGDRRSDVERLLGSDAVEAGGGRTYLRSWSVELSLLAMLEGGELPGGTRRGGVRIEQAQRLFRCRNELLHVGTAATRGELDAAFAAGREVLSWLFERFGWRPLSEVPSLPAGIRTAVDVLVDRAGMAVVP
jgi:hypothetical protein